MGTRTTRRCGVALAAVGALAAAAASAATYIAKTSNTANQGFELANDPQLIQLGEGNGTALAVKTVGPATRLLILFNAECAVAGPNNTQWVLIEILVDGVVASPSGVSHAMCTTDGDSSLDNWVAAASDVSVVVGAGTHTIELRGSQQGVPLGVPGDDWRIGELSLIVIATQLAVAQ